MRARRGLRRGDWAIMLAALIWAAPADAADCSASTSGVIFSDYDPLAPEPLEGVGNVSIRCDSAATFAISLSPGTGSYPARSMLNGVHRMEYNLYTDPSRLLVWGDGSSNTGTVSVTTAAGDFAVYGKVPARQNLPAGSYSDTIVVTIIY
jgi:spore coat protein U-like protein